LRGLPEKIDKSESRFPDRERKRRGNLNGGSIKPFLPLVTTSIAISSGSFKAIRIVCQYAIASSLTLLAMDPAIKSQDDTLHALLSMVISSEARNLKSVGC
jgi:hypothetical protein